MFQRLRGFSTSSEQIYTNACGLSVWEERNRLYCRRGDDTARFSWILGKRTVTTPRLQYKLRAIVLGFLRAPQLVLEAPASGSARFHRAHKRKDAAESGLLPEP